MRYITIGKMGREDFTGIAGSYAPPGWKRGFFLRSSEGGAVKDFRVVRGGVWTGGHKTVRTGMESNVKLNPPFGQWLPLVASKINLTNKSNSPVCITLFGHKR